jgi:hypothetical protein
MSLRQRLNELASSFASSVLNAIRGASVEELLTGSTGGSTGNGRRSSPRPVVDGLPARPARRRGGRLPRRSADDIAQVVEQILGLLRQNPKGLRAEQIREKLSLQAKELPRPLKEALDLGRIGKSGQKRATTYFVKGSGAASKPVGRASAAGRRARRAPAGRKGRVRASGRARPVDKTKRGTAASGAAPPAQDS